MGFWHDKRVVVGISGGIAAYKAPALIRRFREQGAEVTVVVTKAALEFVTRLTLQTVSDRPIYDDLFSLSQEQDMGHIRLAQEADLVVVAPATANLLAKMANGLADDLLSTLLLARLGPVLVAPAMNGAMWRHPATCRSVETLKSDGIAFVGPGHGSLACGDVDTGRLVDDTVIIEAGRRILEPNILAGRTVLITAGPTREAVDPVRYMTNRSSGKMGWAIAKAAVRAGAEVTLIHGPVSQPPIAGIQMIAVQSAEQMYHAVQDHWQVSDVAVFAAAVADYRSKYQATEKIKKEKKGNQLSVEMIQNPDILASVAQWRKEAGAGPLLMGFAAETGQALEKAQRKMVRKGCDLMVVNDVAEPGVGFDVDTNRVVVLDQAGRNLSWPLGTKNWIGTQLINVVARVLNGQGMDVMTEAPPDERVK
ncbi:MAG: bifunctional phosphopantothenoylcysteine decarboxylase/phosphopantothenate--cysteine ligase CoaBC [Magnetococcales bacterium]|nr:bifunctional phosphopantothenoylcysteine decarboxylase/phosphopantothenate--cysteine ligase CoaBC [Magnetococcales bacterium]